MPAFRLALTLSAAAVLIAACESKSADSPAGAVVSSIVQSTDQCSDAVSAIGGAMENSMDANAVAAARDTCNTSSAAISDISLPPEMPSEQADLFAASLRDCAQAQSNVAEMLGVAVSRRAATAADRTRMTHVAGRGRAEACVSGLQKALAIGGDKLSRTDEAHLIPSMPGFF